MTNLINRSTYLALGLTLLILPIQQFWIRIFEANNAPEWLVLVLTNWAAPLIFALALVSLIRLVKIKKSPVDYFLLALLVASSLPVLWSAISVGDWLVGIRYGLVAMLGYLIGRTTIKDMGRLEVWGLVSLRIVASLAAFQLVLWLLGLTGLWQALQLTQDFGAGSFYRLYGSMAGPNQLATFLTIIGLWLFWRRKIGRTEFVLVAVLVVLTFSRSAILGLLAGAFLPLLLLPKTKTVKTAGIVLLLCAIAATLLLIFFEPLRNTFVENRHSDIRVSLLEDAKQRIAESSPTELVFGHGAGLAGPAADVLDNGGFIPENWFIQIFYEFGLVGLLLVLAIFYYSIRSTVRNNNLWGLAILSAMAINSMFLHPLADNFITAFWFWILVGIIISNSTNEKHSD